MISVDKFYGRSKNLALSADRKLHPGEARMYHHASGAFGYLLPPGNGIGIVVGGPMLILYNNSTATRDIKDYLGSVITTLAHGSVAVISLVRGTEVGVWQIDIRPRVV